MRKFDVKWRYMNVKWNFGKFSFFRWNLPHRNILVLLIILGLASSTLTAQSVTDIQNALVSPAAPDSTQNTNKNLKPNPWSLMIYRPENTEKMNDVRCWIKFEDAETGEDVTYKKLKADYAWISTPGWRHKYQKTYYLSGGMVMHINLKPGKYKISVYTPKEKNNMFKTENEGDWTSNVLYYDTEHPTNVIWVVPTANENGFYNGGWVIKGKSPDYYKFAKPVS